MILIRTDYPAWCCPYCGDQVGYLGRAWAWLFGLGFHNCTMRNVKYPTRLDQWFALLMPGLYQIRSRYACDPLHPVCDVDMWRDPDQQRLVLSAHWKDGTKHETHLTVAELDGADQAEATIGIWKARWQEIAPDHVFSDEIVIAYDDAGWRP